MSSEEKAKELIGKFRYPAKIDGSGSSLSAAKACAVICVEEIEKAIDKLESFAAREYKVEARKEWRSVKEHINQTK